MCKHETNNCLLLLVLLVLSTLATPLFVYLFIHLYIYIYIYLYILCIYYISILYIYCKYMQGIYIFRVFPTGVRGWGRILPRQPKICSSPTNPLRKFPPVDCPLTKFLFASSTKKVYSLLTKQQFSSHNPIKQHF